MSLPSLNDVFGVDARTTYSVHKITEDIAKMKSLIETLTPANECEILEILNNWEQTRQQLAETLAELKELKSTQNMEMLSPTGSSHKRKHTGEFLSPLSTMNGQKRATSYETAPDSDVSPSAFATPIVDTPALIHEKRRRIRFVRLGLGKGDESQDISSASFTQTSPSKSCNRCVQTTYMITHGRETQTSETSLQLAESCQTGLLGGLSGATLLSPKPAKSPRSGRNEERIVKLDVKVDWSEDSDVSTVGAASHDATKIELDYAKSQIARLEAELRDTKSVVESLREERTDLRERVASAQRDVTDRSDSLDELRSSVAILEESLANSVRRANQLATAEIEQDLRITELQDMLQKNEVAKTDLSDLLLTRENELSGLRKQLQQAQEVSRPVQLEEQTVVPMAEVEIQQTGEKPDLAAESEILSKSATTTTRIEIQVTTPRKARRRQRHMTCPANLHGDFVGSDENEAGSLKHRIDVLQLENERLQSAKADFEQQLNQLLDAEKLTYLNVLEENGLVKQQKAAMRLRCRELERRNVWLRLALRRAGIDVEAMEREAGDGTFQQDVSNATTAATGMDALEHLQAEIERKNVKVVELENELENLRKEKESTCVKLSVEVQSSEIAKRREESSNVLLEQARQERDALKECCIELEKQIEEVEKRRDVWKERADDCRAERDESQSLVERLRGDVELLRADKESEEQLKASHEDEQRAGMMQAERRCVDLERMLGEEMRKAEAETLKAEEAEAKLDGAIRREAQHRDRAQQAQVKIESLTLRLARAEKLADEKAENIAQLHRQLEEQRQEADRARRESVGLRRSGVRRTLSNTRMSLGTTLEGTTDEMEQCLDELANVEESRAVAESKARSACGEVASMRSRVRDLEQECRSLALKLGTAEQNNGKLEMAVPLAIEKIERYKTECVELRAKLVELERRRYEESVRTAAQMEQQRKLIDHLQQRVLAVPSKGQKAKNLTHLFSRHTEQQSDDTASMRRQLDAERANVRELQRQVRSLHHELAEARLDAQRKITEVYSSSDAEPPSTPSRSRSSRHRVANTQTPSSSSQASTTSSRMTGWLKLSRNGRPARDYWCILEDGSLHFYKDAHNNMSPTPPVESVSLDDAEWHIRYRRADQPGPVKSEGDAAQAIGIRKGRDIQMTLLAPTLEARDRWLRCLAQYVADSAMEDEGGDEVFC